MSLWITSSTSRGKGEAGKTPAGKGFSWICRGHSVLWFSGKHLFCCHFYRCWVHGELELRETSHQVYKSELQSVLPTDDKKNLWRRPPIYSADSRAVLSLGKRRINNIQRNYAYWNPWWYISADRAVYPEASLTLLPVVVKRCGGETWRDMARQRASSWQPQLNSAGVVNQSRLLI